MSSVGPDQLMMHSSLSLCACVFLKDLQHSDKLINVLSQTQSKTYGQHGYGTKPKIGCMNSRITLLGLVTQQTNRVHCWTNFVKTVSCKVTTVSPCEQSLFYLLCFIFWLHMYHTKRDVTQNFCLIATIFFFMQARTGYPFIDAIMTQLRREGWIHHLARHAVACFLTRGDLWISWEEGLKVRNIHF